MERKIVITKKESCIYTALIEDGVLVELRISEETDESHVKLGNIYIGRVKSVNPNIGGAFIEIAPGISCYYQLQQKHVPIFTHKIGKKPLCIGDELVVQVSKEAVKRKVAEVTTNLNLSGSLAVLTYGDTTIGVSNKMTAERKAEIKEWFSEFENTSYGLIIRTNAKTAEKETLLSEIRTLEERYRHIVDTSIYRTCFSCLYQEPPDYITGLRNTYADGLTEIVIEDESLYNQVREYLQKERPGELPFLRKYQDSLLSLHKLYNIDTEITHALDERVWLKNGGCLVIQQTEAMTVIDVNSGKFTRGKDAQKTYLKVNLEAAKEIARQIRLRNLSGIILIDFINLQEQENVRELLRVFRRELAQDPVLTTLVDITKLYLVEVTRRKVRKTLAENIRTVQQNREGDSEK